MSKKFFSLIHEGSFYIAPETKRIPAAEFSELVSAKEMLLKVQKDAAQYRKEVASECESLKERSIKEGFEAGFSRWAEKLAELEAEIKKIRQETEQMVVPVALKAAKKIVNREIETSTSVILDIITNAIKAVAQHKKIVIYVSKQDYSFVEKEKNTLLKYFEEAESLAIIPKEDVEKGGCIIETEGGIINAQLANQWIILENAFQGLIKPTPSTAATKGGRS